MYWCQVRNLILQINELRKDLCVPLIEMHQRRVFTIPATLLYYKISGHKLPNFFVKTVTRGLIQHMLMPVTTVNGGVFLD